MADFIDDRASREWARRNEKEESGCVTFWIIIAVLIFVLVWLLPIGYALLSD